MILRPCAIALLLAGQVIAAPPVIDDQKLIENLKDTLGELADKKAVPTADELATKAKSAPRIQPALPLPGTPAKAPENRYESLSRSVYLVSTIYKCGKCKHWHQGGSASAWCIASDGVMVTNAHVFITAKGEAMGVTDREGKCHAVTELLGIDAGTDVALFRVKAEGLQALPIGATAEVGDPVTIISSPEGNLFVRTAGNVARYTKSHFSPDKAKTTWMTVTADYAKGSSGGPVFNQSGEVVGMVSYTHSIYSQSQSGVSKGSSPKGDLQMVIRNCVPIESVRELFGPEIKQ